ncbi:MAG: hypothetical protein V9G12_22745 [Microthrixaceae bacterium]
MTGAALCWGGNGTGQLGLGDTVDHLVPTLVIGGMGPEDVGVGAQHACLRESTALKCFGAGAQGRLGNGSTDDHNEPVTVSSAGAASGPPAVGREHACSVLTNGQVQCWGANAAGQLGNGTTTDSAVAIVVTGV